MENVIKTPCPFCGQMVMVENRDEYADVASDKLGATVCRCAEAQAWRTNYNSKKKAAETSAELIEYAERKGISITEADKQVILQMANAVIDERFYSITVKVSGITIKLALNKEKALSFNIKYKEEWERQT